MAAIERVLLVGGTGRTGGRVLEQLVGRGVPVRALARAAARLPRAARQSPLVEPVEGALLALSDAELQALVRGCGAVISCLGHTLTFRGIFGPPRDLVAAAAERLCRAVGAERPERPVRFALMSSVSVNHPAEAEPRRGTLERALLAVLRAALPPAKDNQRAADLLWRGFGAGHPFVEWAVVRPDTLREGPVTDYALDEHLRASLFRPAETNLANVAHFLCELATDGATWERWRGRMPVVWNRR